MFPFTTNIQTIQPAELRQLLSKPDAPILLDVRQPEEHAEKNIPHSILIPLGELPTRVHELTKYKDKEIVVYCRSGNRSAQACTFLNQHGFHTKNLVGGMLKW